MGYWDDTIIVGNDSVADEILVLEKLILKSGEQGVLSRSKEVMEEYLLWDGIVGYYDINAFFYVAFLSKATGISDMGIMDLFGTTSYNANEAYNLASSWKTPLGKDIIVLAIKTMYSLLDYTGIGREENLSKVGRNCLSTLYEYLHGRRTSVPAFKEMSGLKRCYRIVDSIMSDSTSLNLSDIVGLSKEVFLYYESGDYSPNYAYPYLLDKDMNWGDFGDLKKAVSGVLQKDISSKYDRDAWKSLAEDYDLNMVNPLGDLFLDLYDIGPIVRFYDKNGVFFLKVECYTDTSDSIEIGVDGEKFLNGELSVVYGGDEIKRLGKGKSFSAILSSLRKLLVEFNIRYRGVAIDEIMIILSTTANTCGIGNSISTTFVEDDGEFLTSSYGDGIPHCRCVVTLV